MHPLSRSADLLSPPNHSLFSPERRHGSSIVPGHAFLASHDCVLCTFRNRSAPDRGKWCGPSGQAVWTVHHPAGSLSSSQPGGPSCWARSLAFGLIAPHFHRRSTDYSEPHYDSFGMSSIADLDRMFLGLADPDPLVRGTDPDPSIIKQK